MPNFTCDICGGAIKMQANKTGICQNCGMEYDIEAIRAMVGSQTSAPAPKSSASPAEIANQNSGQEISRDALLNYLKNVRTAETIIYNNNRAISKLQSESERLAELVQIEEKKDIPFISISYDFDKRCEKEKLNYKKGKKLMIQLLISFLILAYSSSILLHFSKVFFGSELFWVFVCLISVTYVDILLLKLWSHGGVMTKSKLEKKLQKIQEEKEIQDRRIEEHDRLSNIKRKKVEEAELNQYDFDRKKEKEYIPQIEEENQEMSKLLKKAYSANIIPLQFRNIEGVYYLYDYLSTSNQTLSEALMQANLEAIKQRIDSMLKLQSIQIIQQQQTNKELQALQESNKHIMLLAEQTANNTAIAAKYAAISAANTEIIKVLSQKQLAYQKAEFWLK